jgi:two-component system, LytTR family, response regulator
MKRVLIIDDEQDARDLLRFYISQHKEFLIIGEASNGIEAVQLINKLKPATIFLDIQMPGLTGFEVLTQLDEIPEIIFSTAYDQYAIKAFEIHAVDYLLKPYGKSRFESALHRIQKRQDNIIPFTEELLSNEKDFPEKIILHKGVRKMMVTVTDIIYGEAFGDYTKIYTLNGEFLSTKGISYFIEKLNKKVFIRLHRSHFVNHNFIIEIKKTDRYFYACLIRDINIKISESYLPEIRKLLF